MATLFSDIYEMAVFRLTDYSFLDDIPTESKRAILQKYLLSSVVDFQHSCSQFDLTDYDLEQCKFNTDLDYEVKDILALGIAYHWLSAKTLNGELLKNKIHSKDYTSYSPANLLGEIKELREIIKQEYFGRIRTYSFRNSEIGDLKV